MLLKIWERIRRVVVDQRGEVGASLDEFTDEEKAAMSMEEPPGDETKEGEIPGVVDPEKPPEEKPTTEPAKVIAEPPAKGAEPAPAVTPTEAEPETSPRYQARINELVRKEREAQEKLELLEINPQEYYKKYPRELAVDYANKEAYAVGSITQPRRTEISMPPLTAGAPTEKVQEWERTIEGGEHDGKVFKDVFEADPDYAYRTFPRTATQYEWYLLDERRQEVARREAAAAENEREAREFTDGLSSEFFGKKFEALTVDEQAVVAAERNKVLGWIEANTFYAKTDMLKRARMLMDPTKAIAKAKAQGAESVLEATRRGRVQTISAHTESAQVTGWEWWEKAGPGEAEKALDKMGETAFLKFLKDAPESVRNRDILSGLPWK